MPICRKCNEDKPTEAFYAYQPGECRACICARVRRHRRLNESVREYDRARAKAPERKAKARETTVRWREENPDAYRAQTAVGNAIRDGKLRKEPCLFCGSVDVHAHHRDYARPLDVVWLCAKCHHRAHALFEAEGANKR